MVGDQEASLGFEVEKRDFYKWSVFSKNDIMGVAM